MEIHGPITLVIFILAGCCASDDKICFAQNCVGSHVSVLIPARAGSKGIKNKNLARVGNETLLARTIRIVNQCGGFDSVWVSTDGDAIADEAVAHRAEVHRRRPETATDNATSLSAVRDFLDNHEDVEVVAVVQCTSPFIQSKFLRSALDLMSAGVDCVFAVSSSHQLRWTRNKHGFAVPVNFDPKRRPRRQDWAGDLVENGMFYFVKRKLVLSDGVLQNDRCKVVEIPVEYSLEIDTEHDLLVARSLLHYMNE